MSCFIVKDECLIDVLTLIKKYDPSIIGSLTDAEFLNELARLNMEAYFNRYCESNPLSKKEFKTESARHELTMLFNSISYVYQCAEGKVQNIALFKAIENFTNKMLVKFDQKYIMGSEMKHERNTENAYNALQLYMKNNKIEWCWGS